MRNVQKGFSVLLVPIILTAALLAVVFLKIQKQQPSPIYLQPTPPLIETLDTSDWKTYANEEFEIEFKYPSHWILNKENNLVYAPNNEGLMLYVNTTDKTIDNHRCMDFVNSKTYNNLLIQKHIARDVENISDKCWGQGMGESIISFISKRTDNANTYKAGYTYSKDQEAKAENLLNQILSTFKFLDSTGINPPTPSSAIDKGCVRDGCSGQVCRGEEESPVNTTCEYKEEYGCYNTAICEKQGDGKCGWTMTDTLTACLNAI